MSEKIPDEIWIAYTKFKCGTLSVRQFDTAPFIPDDRSPIKYHSDTKYKVLEEINIGLEEENKRLRDALERIKTASEFHSQDGISEHVIRYAHESTSRLAKQALEGGDDGAVKAEFE